MGKTAEPISKTKNLYKLLNGKKFKLDYYQREYCWGERQIKDLIDDLYNKFKKKHKPDNELEEVKNYDHYFLGSITISDKEGEKFIIDGQQRLVTLSLLLIHIYRLFNDEQRKERLKGKYTEEQYEVEQNMKEDIQKLICSTEAGKRYFNIEVGEWKDCIQKLLSGVNYVIDKKSKSIRNIVKNFEKIKELFRIELNDELLPYFTEWLTKRVYLDVVTAYSDDDSYIIFETMNDRGVILTPTEMLKGYILAHIKEEYRNTAHEVWREQVAKLQDISPQEDGRAIRIWLRSRYAKNIKDFNLIGTKFNRWVYDNKKAIGLEKSPDFFNFIEEFKFYSEWYICLRNAEKSPEEAKKINQNWEVVNFCGQSDTILFMLLASLEPEEVRYPDIIKQKLKIVFSYLDILTAQEHWNRGEYYLPNQQQMLDIRDNIKKKDIPTLADKLTNEIGEKSKLFDEWRGSLTPAGRNGRKIKKLLARMTDYVETCSGGASRYQDYLTNQIEHIWGEKHHEHVKGFEGPTGFSEFGWHRNYIGALILLKPRGKNQSLGGRLYEEKVEYYTDNLLAHSLHDKAYKHNPGFNRFVSSSGLHFKPYPHFGKEQLLERQRLYKYLAEKIWDPERLKRAAASEE